MKDSYGSAFSFMLFMFFFVVYVCFIAVALNFAKTYRVKNNVINILEQYEYAGGQPNEILSAMLTDYLKGAGYSYDKTLAVERCKRFGEIYVVTDEGVCISQVPQEKDQPANYFKVEVYFGASFPVLLLEDKLTIPISGETGPVEKRAF